MCTFALGVTSPPGGLVGAPTRVLHCEARALRHQSAFFRISVLRNNSLALAWLAGSVPITADYGTRNGNVGPGCFSQPAAGADLNFRCMVQPGPQPCLEALLSHYLG